MITMALYNIIDTFWVARLGYQAIAALTVVLPYHVLVIAIGVGTGIGINALASRRFGERNIEATNHVAGQIFSLAGLCGVIFLMAAVFFAEPILSVMGATPDIMGYATQYLTVLGFGMPFLFFMIMAGSLLRGSGDALRPMIFMITASVVNIILDPFLIFGIGPFPEMGVRGAALATVIAQLLGAGLSFYYIVARKSAYQVKLAYLRPSLSILRDIYRLLPIVGFSFGARLWNRLWRAVKLASGGLMLVMGVAVVVLEIFAPELIGIFSDDPELMVIAVPAMRIFLSTLVIVGPSILFITTFQGLSKGKEALVLSLIRQFVFFVPLLFLLPRILGIDGVWLSVPISDTLAFIVSGLWLFREYKLQQRTGAWVDIPVPGAESGD